MTPVPGASIGSWLAQRELTLPLAETFGPTPQGEGPHTGRPAVFIRFGHCNLSCSWCDTPYTWDTSRYDLDRECPDTSVETIATNAMSRGAKLFILTGGEPMMHQRKPAMHVLLSRLRGAGEIHVETNGTIPPIPAFAEHITHFTVSPKLANTGADPLRRRINHRALKTFTDLANSRRACFKFVAMRPEDVDEVYALTVDYDIPTDAVWIMPEGVTAANVIRTHRDLIDHILARGFNTTTRLHTLLWEQERAR
ncbi:7-carboxy-7-deazaguanine synthase QueE [Saccharomonospora azurea]|uniref:7-carboxy-7-deazaguanine synthase QueE n=1 Tax=Saccharomonospora azurea TaxID=40988 RepID=UPI003331A7A0